MASKKYLNLDPNILLEWEYDSSNIAENYTVFSDLSKNTRNFLSSTNLNDIDYNLFVVDTVQKKYSKVDPVKFNFIKIQDYSSSPVSYDKVTLYFPSNYNFSVYYGFYLKIYAMDYLNRGNYTLSNFYFDKSQAQSVDGIIEYSDKLINLGTPFIYNQKEWGKYITYYIPSVNAVANQRYINPTTNTVIPNSINDNLTKSIGLSVNSPIYLEFSFMTSKQTIFDIPYYYMGDTYKTSLSIQPEYQSLGVMVQESTQGDFFEIYGFYNNSNENLDNFVNELESKGRKINIEYIVTLYEENLTSGFPLTFLVTENFAQKIEYRPIIKYSNTTAAIDVEMKIIDLVDNSSFSRFASIGLTNNLLKYGKTLSKLDVGNVSKPKIYNYKYDKIYDFKKTSSNVVNNEIGKVPFPILINVYKILSSNYNPSVSSDYKSMGLLNIILTPFDNIMKFQIAKQDSPDGPIVPYNLSELLLNSKLNLVFRSDSKSIEKDVYYQTDENRFEMGVVVFKINQEDMSILKQMAKDKFDNFYIILNANKTKTLIYSGKFKIFDNLKFLQTTTIVNTNTGSTTAVDNSLIDVATTTTTNQSQDALAASQVKSQSSGGLNDIVPPQFDADGIPTLQADARGTLDSYRNMVIWVKAGITKAQLNEVVTNLKNIVVNINFAYQTPTSEGATIIILERVEIEKVQRIKNIPNIVNTKEMMLDFGWKKSSDKTYDFSQFGLFTVNPNLNIVNVSNNNANSTSSSA